MCKFLFDDIEFSNVLYFPIWLFSILNRKAVYRFPKLKSNSLYGYTSGNGVSCTVQLMNMFLLLSFQVENRLENIFVGVLCLGQHLASVWILCL